MGVNYAKGPDDEDGSPSWDAEYEVDRIKGLRARCDNDLHNSINRCEKKAPAAPGADPVTERCTCDKCRFWLTTFAALAQCPSACVASFRDRANPSNAHTEKVVYAVTKSMLPPPAFLAATVNVRIHFDP